VFSGISHILRIRTNIFINNFGVVMLWILLMKKKKMPMPNLVRYSTSAPKNQMPALFTFIIHTIKPSFLETRKRSPAETPKVKIKLLMRIDFNMERINFLNTNI
jgi:hypothetical protein